MKKTFTKDDEIAVDCKGSLALKKFLVEYALSKNVPVFRDTLEHIREGNGSFPNVTWSNRELCGTYSSSDSMNNGKTWISVEKFMEYCDNWVDCKSVEFRLNNEYTAEINKISKTVKVGCQTFSFEVIEKLYLDYIK